MNTKEDLQTRIASLAYAKGIIDKEHSILREQLDELTKKDELTQKGELTKKDELTRAENPAYKNHLTKRMAEFFSTCGFDIREYQSEKPNEKLYSLGKQVWKSYKVSVPFLKVIYKNLKSELPLEYDISPFSAEESNALRNLCQSMAKLEWLEFSMEKSIIKVHQKILKSHKVFLNGGWAEEVNRYLIFKTLHDYAKEHVLKYKVFWDVKLKVLNSENSNSCDMQLDIVVDLKDRFYVIETKTGALGIDKWVDRARIFNKDGNRFITCCMDDIVNPKLFHPFRLLALPKLEQQFTELLNEDYPVKEAEA